MTDTRIHPVTGKRLKRDVRPMVLTYATLSRTIMAPGWYPDDESDAIHAGADLAEYDPALQQMKEAYARHIRAVRKKLKLTQEEAGRLIGGGRRAFQKYESGAMAPSDAAIGLIELLNRRPEDLEVLRALRPAA